jgi:uncharacterized protein (TIGR02246 family)
MGTTFRYPDVAAPSNPITDDTRAIHELFHDLLGAWARRDASGYAALFTEDADYVAFDGSHTRGRQAIADSHQPLFDRWLKGTRLVGRVTQIRFLAPGVALVHATGGTVFPDETRPRPSRDSIQTLVAVRNGGEWLFTAFHNTRILRRTKLQWILFGIVDKVFRR